MSLSYGLQRILLIEDDVDDCDIFRWATQEISPNIQLVTCKNCMEAPGAIAGLAPEIIFLDLHLPIKNGLLYLEELQERSDTKAIPVVIYSSHAKPEHMESASRLGAKMYLEKTDSYPELLKQLTHILSGKQWETGSFNGVAQTNSHYEM